ncbi:hypothetical protein EW146_g286 [Bondarzewia mesenterica]|uniref:RING-type domain-containing protein n=1 Tax=Bondarzewia mesenterica TaxID=1095465 RepID=A0A4V3XGF3_9AGAM|nr:hypothetical protein EW146_g286 [Bondarzewia mesenterica]
MSSREPMWFCHECHAEMRPLMVPDPHCASCNGTFVEKIESDADDPRTFQESGPAIEDGFTGPGFDNFLFTLSELFNPGGASRAPTSPAPTQDSPGSGRSPDRSNSQRPAFRIEINQNAPGRGGARTFVLGGPPTLDAGGRGRTEDTSIAGPLMAQYLLSMLASRSPRDGRDDPSNRLGFNLGGEGAENGRWGDYVFNQEALDQIITQIMENSNSSHPVPATEEVMSKLDRQVLEEGSPLLEHDCAVCKEQFSLATEDPDEQVVVVLPCKHPFHDGCITPWLKSSGTCPVCRYQLVPQPEHHSPNPGPSSGSNRPSPPTRQSGNSGNSGASGPGGRGGGVFNSLFNIMSGSHNTSSGSGGSGGRGGNNSSSSGSFSTAPVRRSSQEEHDIPGGWLD